MKRKLKVEKIEVVANAFQLGLSLTVKHGLLKRPAKFQIGAVPNLIGHDIIKIIKPELLGKAPKDPRFSLGDVLDKMLDSKTIKEVYIYSKAKEGYFIAKIVLRDGRKYNIIPSVGILLALITETPIYVDASLIPPPKILQPYLA